jgi:protein-S-isoprenylcysteine O-methyltransferase Ste14
VNIIAGITLLNWFQLLLLAGFFIVTVSRSLHIWVQQRINPITLNLGKDGILGMMEIFMFIGMNLWSIELVMHCLPQKSYLFPWPFNLALIDTGIAKIAGVLFCVIAFLFLGTGLIALGNSWRLGIDQEKPGTLVTSGIYSISRNPIYIFFDLWFLGTFLIQGTFIFLIFAILTAINLHYQIIKEEQILVDLHGSAYENYRKRVPRYIHIALLIKWLGRSIGWKPKAAID